ncbi:MAG TPA: anthranilate phosphoribosyltransferase, partial [Myxococcaceae bacterium]|nr:anthranilate phosphoribosyltransferase [Myxococcaceae bacterium]
QVREVVLHPEDGGLRPVPPGALQGGTPEENALLLAGILEGRGGPLRDAVLLNAGAALWVADAVQTLAEGVLRAAESIDSGAARVRLERLIAFSRAGVAA